MRLLDLYCGEGLAAWGYWLSGRFSEIIGVDIDPNVSTRYSFDFVCADALRLDYEFLLSFDFVHASPPCQAYSKITPDRSRHPRLIAATHLMLAAAGMPYVIENVEGSSRELRPNLVMNGAAFGLPSDRRRYFHVTGLRPTRKLMKVSSGIHVHGGSIRRSETIRAMGLECIPEKRISCLSQDGMEQGVPPVMTRWIAEQLFPNKAMIA